MVMNCMSCRVSFPLPSSWVENPVRPMRCELSSTSLSLVEVYSCGGIKSPRQSKRLCSQRKSNVGKLVFIMLLCSTEHRMYINISRRPNIPSLEGSAQSSQILNNKTDRRHVLVPSTSEVIVGECQNSNDSKDDNGPVEVRKSSCVADQDV